MKKIMYLMLVFGIMLTMVANGNVVKKDSTYHELRGNQIFKITSFTTITDTSYVLNGVTFFKTQTITDAFEYLETVIGGDSAVVSKYLPVDMYLHSNEFDSVFVYQTQNIIFVIDYAWGMFPYLYSKYFIKEYFLFNGQLVLKESIDKNIEICLMIVYILGFFVLSFFIVYRHFIDKPNLRFLYIIWLIVFLFLYTFIIYSSGAVFELKYEEYLFFISCYGALPGLIFILFAYREKAKFLNQFEAAKANLDRE